MFYVTTHKIYYDCHFLSLPLYLLNECPLLGTQTSADRKGFVEKRANIQSFPREMLCHMFKHDLLKRSENFLRPVTVVFRGIKFFILMTQCCVAEKNPYASVSFEGSFCNPPKSSHVHMQLVSLIYDPRCFLNVSLS